MKKAYFVIPLVVLCTLACVVINLDGTATPQPVTSIPVTVTHTVTPTVTEVYLTPVTDVKRTCIVTAQSLNVRLGPGIDYGVFAWFYIGDSVTILPIPHPENWLPIDVAGKIGWVHSKFCEVTHE